MMPMRWILAWCGGGAALAIACNDNPAVTDGTTSGGPLGPTSASTSQASTEAVDGSSTTGVASTSTTASTVTTTSSTGDPTSDDDPVFDLGVPDVGPSPGTCVAEAPLLAAVPCDPLDVTLAAPFARHYDCFDLGQVPNVPPSLGGVTFSREDPDVLLVGGAANTPAGQLYAIRVTRDASCHVTGFAEPQAQPLAEAPYNDGGVAHGPDDVLFLARWPVNELGQLLPGSTVTDRVDLLAPLGVGSSSIAGLTFVPATYPGEGQLKLVTWSGGEWFTLPLAPAGDGTFVPGLAVPGPVLGGGPEGIVYVSGDNEGFDGVSVLVAEWSAGNVATYLVDAQGDPLVGTRQDFIVGLSGALGAHIDPTSGDFLFSTFGGGDRVVVITGFVPNPPPQG